MKNNADNILGKAPSLLPTGGQGSSESVSILRDLDPRATKFGASPPSPYKIFLLVATPLAIGVGLLSWYFHSSTAKDGSDPMRTNSTGKPNLSVERGEAVKPSSAFVAPKTTIGTEKVGPAVILAHTDPAETQQAQPSASDILAENDAGQQSRESGGQSNKEALANASSKTGDPMTNKQANQKKKIAVKTANARLVKNTGTNKAQIGSKVNKAIEREIDIVTAIVKNSPD